MEAWLQYSSAGTVACDCEAVAGDNLVACSGDAVYW